MGCSEGKQNSINIGSQIDRRPMRFRWSTGVRETALRLKVLIPTEGCRLKQIQKFPDEFDGLVRIPIL